MASRQRRGIGKGKTALQPASDSPRVQVRNIFPFQPYMHGRSVTQSWVAILYMDFGGRSLKTSSRTLELIDGQEES